MPVQENPSPVVGIICEYDPFHLGHARQFALIRQKMPNARIVCLMSGVFTQRGMPALHAPLSRAEAALLAGADMVLELPCAFSVRDAEHFALGGVSILSRLKFVTHLCFGVEERSDFLLPAARLLESPTPAFTAALKEALAQGAAFAKAQGQALSACLPHEGQAPWEKPNNILALCYLRAVLRLNSKLIPLPVLRQGAYHAQTLNENGYPSATAVRRAFLDGRFEAADAACGYELQRTPVCPPTALDILLLHKLRTAAPAWLRALPNCTEGLENRLKACAAENATREMLLSALKTKRYAHARLSRLCCHALLDITADFLAAHPLPESVRLLGLRRGSPLTACLKQSGFPVIAKAANGDLSSPLYQLDMRAYELWALGAGLPAGLMLRQGVKVV